MGVVAAVEKASKLLGVVAVVEKASYLVYLLLWRRRVIGCRCCSGEFELLGVVTPL